MIFSRRYFKGDRGYGTEIHRFTCNTLLELWSNKHGWIHLTYECRDIEERIKEHDWIEVDEEEFEAIKFIGELVS